MATSRPSVQLADRPTRAKVLAVLLLLTIPIAGLFAGYWLKANNYLPTLIVGTNEDASMPALPEGLGIPVQNKLDPRFSDGNGDLIADPPTDPAAQLNPPELVVSLPPLAQDQSPTELWQPLAAHLSEEVGKPVRFHVAMLESQLPLRAMVDGEVHVAVFGSGNVCRAVNAAGFVPVARLPGIDGSGTTRTALAVPASLPQLQTPADLQGRELAFVNASSNAGFKVPFTVLRNDFGLIYGRDYTWVFKGTESAVIGALKEMQPVAVSKETINRAVEAGELSEADFRIIYESEPLPMAAVGYGHALEPTLAAKVREAILSFDWRGTPLEAQLGGQRTTFVPADFKKDWALARQVDDATGFRHTLD